MKSSHNMGIIVRKWVRTEGLPLHSLLGEWEFNSDNWVLSQILDSCGVPDWRMCVQIPLSSFTINSILISCENAIWIPRTYSPSWEIIHALRLWGFEFQSCLSTWRIIWFCTFSLLPSRRCPNITRWVVNTHWYSRILISLSCSTKKKKP